MDDQCEPIICTDDTQLITMHIPCRLVERAEKYVTGKGHTVTGAVIEALDAFLQEQFIVNACKFNTCEEKQSVGQS